MTDQTDTGSREDLGYSPITRAEQNAWQRQAATLLSKLLERAASEGLPPIAWTVQRAGATLVGHCYAPGPAERRAEFNAWRLAIASWAGHGADVKREHADSAGTVRLVDQWERVRLAGPQSPGVHLTLTADIYAEDDQ